MNNVLNQFTDSTRK